MTLAHKAFAIGLLTGVLLGFMGAQARAQDRQINIITAIDDSLSITDDERRLQFEGLARGVQNERFLERLGDGVGFAVFAWSSGTDFRVIVPWTVLRGPQDAAAVAVVLSGQVEAGRPAGNASTGLTDLGEAIFRAVAMGTNPALPGGRVVINVMTDSTANRGQHPSVSRDAAANLGFTINGVVFGNSPLGWLETYFRDNVLTGPGAFVEVARTPDELVEILEKKFFQDLVASL